MFSVGINPATVQLLNRSRCQLVPHQAAVQGGWLLRPLPGWSACRAVEVCPREAGVGIIYLDACLLLLIFSFIINNLTIQQGLRSVPLTVGRSVREPPQDGPNMKRPD